MKTMICPSCWGSGADLRPANPQCVVCPTCRGEYVIPDVRLGEYFWLSEFVRSETATRKLIPNMPSEAEIENLKRLVSQVLDPTRAFFGPLYVSSGYRCLELNTKIGGSKTSVHPNGDASDFSPIRKGVTRKEVVEWMASEWDILKFDQLIFEGTWIHTGRVGPTGQVRADVMMMFPDKDGNPKYFRYDASDRRVV